MRNTLYFTSNYNQNILNDIRKEANITGYYDLPTQNTSHIDNYLNELDRRQHLNTITDIVIIGIGGSNLGAKAIYEFINPVKILKRKLHFIDTTDPVFIHQLCNKLCLSKTHFIVISKSGTTIETIAIYKYLLSLIKNTNYGFNPFTFITDKKSLLERHAKATQGIIVNTADNISGRFSVLSAIGIIPLVLAGINIKELLNGANKLKNNFFTYKDIHKPLIKKACFYAQNINNYNINAVFSYANSMQHFNKWYQQLWGESLGKKQISTKSNISLTPIGLIGPQEQHSFLQLLIEGINNKTVTFIKITQSKKRIKIPNISLLGLEKLDIINNIEFSTLINLQADTTIELLKNLGQIPLDEIIIDKQDEFCIGQLIYYYELLTSITGILLNINTYNQPGVEAGKKLLIQNLKKIN